tara:strand:+ start:75 stop:1136 length:1062 start_codon:yes stop_codon:yes gene_type:complete
MSTLKVDGIRSNSASSDAITLASDGTCTADISNRPNYNLLINGQFDIWQRKTDSGSNSSDEYVADRWRVAASGATKQITRQAFTLGQTDVPSNPKYYLRFAVTTGNNNCALRQRIEGVDRVQGAVTLSFWVKGTNPAGGHFNITNRQDFGTGGSASNVVDTDIGDFTVTTSWVKKTFTFTPPSISGKTFGTNNNSYYELEVFRQPSDDTGTAAYTIDIANVKLEYGSSASDYQRINVAQELALCQRYFTRLGYGSQYAYVAAGILANSTSPRCGPFVLPTTMRAAPTATKVGTLIVDSETSAGTEVTAISSAQTTVSGGRLDFTCNSHAEGAGQSIHILSNTATSGLDFSSEL